MKTKLRMLTPQPTGPPLKPLTMKLPVALSYVFTSRDVLSPTLDMLRHKGRTNVLFLDGHVTDVPITNAALAQVYLAR